MRPRPSGRSWRSGSRGSRDARESTASFELPPGRSAGFAGARTAVTPTRSGEGGPEGPLHTSIFEGRGADPAGLADVDHDVVGAAVLDLDVGVPGLAVADS